MRISIDLGQSLFPSLNKNLALSLQASASVLLPPDSTLPHDPKQLREVLCSGNAWVTQATQVMFDVYIASGAHMSFSISPQIVALVCKAKNKMWSDLGLAVVYKSIAYDQEQTCHLSFHFQKRFEPQDKSETPRTPKILRGLADAVPPIEVPIVRICSIDMRLRYSYAYERTMQRPSQSSHDQSADTNQSTETSTYSWNRTNYSSSSLSLAEENNDLLLEIESAETSERPTIANHAMLKLCDASELDELFQNALKALVVGDAGRLRKQKRTNDDLQCLAKIAPSVFKLGYREAMNKRSRLMPSITKSLASMLERSDNKALKDKLLSDRTSHGTYSGTSDPSTDDSNPIKVLLKTELWNIAQKRLYHAPTPKALKHSPNAVSNPDRNKRIYEDDIIPESISEQTTYSGYDLNSFVPETDSHSDLFLESIYNGPDLESELDFQGANDSSSSIMILGENNPSHQAHLDTLADDLHIANPQSRSLPLYEEPAPMTPLSPRIPVLLNSNMADSDSEMLDFDTLENPELPLGSASRGCPSPVPHFPCKRPIQPEDKSSQKVGGGPFQHSPHAFTGLLQEEDDDWNELLYGDYGE